MAVLSFATHSAPEHLMDNHTLMIRAFSALLACAAVVVTAPAQVLDTIQDDLLIKTPDGASVSVVVVRRKGLTTPQPAALFYNIYTNLGPQQAMEAAAYGYVGVAAYPRGKLRSADPIEPFEHDVTDINTVIDWISKQPWSDGQVGMYGGSFSGYAQWAALKRPHPALRTIVPVVANNPGHGLPMENNVFIMANYAWPFYVADNRYLDERTYHDTRWQSLPRQWYASGRPYREVDGVSGTPNKWLQRWLMHPAYDEYWQARVPYKNDYSKINIPVLAINGYYDDGQISSLLYLKEHYKYNSKAEHYMVIGPYSHGGTQAARKPEVVNGYRIDPVAQFDTSELTFQWFDHVMRGGRRPDLVRDRINYQVMGANDWRHAPSLGAMSQEIRTFYLTDTQSGEHRRLSTERPSRPGFLEQTVDFADRQTVNNSDYYPAPIMRPWQPMPNGFSFVSEPFEEPITMAGEFTGEIRATINKRDMDLGVVLYEVTPDGDLFHLSYFLGPASYAGVKAAAS
jgi:putative CocE/NonD family hydrolase